MNSTTTAPNNDLWSQVTPLVISFISMLGTVLIAYISKRLGTHVKETRIQILELNDKHDLIKKSLESASPSGSVGQQEQSEDIHEVPK